MTDKTNKPETCPKCQRPFATAEDFRAANLIGKCPAGYAIRDPDAANDCEEYSFFTLYARSAFEYLNQQLATALADKERAERESSEALTRQRWQLCAETDETLAELKRVRLAAKEEIERLQGERTSKDRYALLGKYMFDCCEALGDAESGTDVPRDRAINSYIEAHAKLKSRAEAAELDAKAKGEKLAAVTRIAVESSDANGTLAIEGAQFLRLLSCYRRVDDTDKFFAAIVKSEKVNADLISILHPQPETPKP